MSRASISMTYHPQKSIYPMNVKALERLLVHHKLFHPGRSYFSSFSFSTSEKGVEKRGKDLGESSGRNNFQYTNCE